jgi:hypothetical protein
MVALSSHDFARCLFNTGMAGLHGIPSGDLLALVRATRTIQSNEIKSRIVAQLDACDIAYRNTDMTREPSTYKALTTGDVNRAEVRFSLKEAANQWWEFYLQQCDRLCSMLWVPNYWREEVARYRFERLGAEFIMVENRQLFGDSSLNDKINLPLLLAGGSGF